MKANVIQIKTTSWKKRYVYVIKVFQNTNKNNAANI